MSFSGLQPHAFDRRRSRSCSSTRRSLRPRRADERLRQPLDLWWGLPAVLSSNLKRVTLGNMELPHGPPRVFLHESSLSCGSCFERTFSFACFFGWLFGALLAAGACMSQGHSIQKPDGIQCCREWRMLATGAGWGWSSTQALPPSRSSMSIARSSSIPCLAISFDTFVTVSIQSASNSHGSSEQSCFGCASASEPPSRILFRIGRLTAAQERCGFVCVRFSFSWQPMFFQYFAESQKRGTQNRPPHVVWVCPEDTPGAALFDTIGPGGRRAPGLSRRGFGGGVSQNGSVDSVGFWLPLLPSQKRTPRRGTPPDGSRLMGR